MEKRAVGPLVAEFIGTFALVFTIVLVITQYTTAGSVYPNGVSFPFIAAAHVLILFMMISVLGPISGGHFNPAITWSLTAAREMKVTDAVLYTIAQVLGAIAAPALAYALFKTAAGNVNYGATIVNESKIRVGAGFALEALMTFFLVWAVIGTAIRPKDTSWAPLAIGATLGLGVLLIAPYTGAGINPARSFGPALISGDWGPGWQFPLVYVAGPLLGGMLAAFLYKGLYMTGELPRPEPEPPLPGREL